MISLVFKSLWETLSMVGVSAALSLFFGLPLAVLLVVTAPGGIKPRPWLYSLSGFFVNCTRSIPYLILMVLFMPITRFIVGTTIGTCAAIVPLTVAGILLMARSMEDNLRGIPRGLLEVGMAFGATTTQIIKSILLKEAFPHLISSFTTVVINLIGFSAMAGAVGGGGLGDIAIRYGYQRYNMTLMFVIVVLLMVLVQAVQMVGDWAIRRVKK